MIIAIDYMENGEIVSYDIKDAELVTIFSTEKFGEILSVRAGENCINFRFDYIVDWSVM